MKKQKDTVITNHLKFNPSHETDFDNYKIVDTETNTGRRKVSEMLYIKNYGQQALNAKTDLKNLDFSYNRLNSTQHLFDSNNTALK